MPDDVRQQGYRPKTLGADKAYDTRECVRVMRNGGGRLTWRSGCTR